MNVFVLQVWRAIFEHCHSSLF